MMERDMTTRTGARAPGVCGDPLNGGAQSSLRGPTQSGANSEVTRRAKDGCKPGDGQRMPGAGLSWTLCWEGPVRKASLPAVLGKTRRTEVRPVKTGVFSRRQACRGKSQAPRSLDSRVAGNQNPEAYRQGLPWGDHESPGRNDSERKCGLEKPDPRAEPASGGRRQNGVPKSDRCGIATSAG